MRWPNALTIMGLVFLAACSPRETDRFDLVCTGRFSTGEPFHEILAIDLQRREWCDLAHCTEAKRSPIAKINKATITLADQRVNWLNLGIKQTIDRPTNNMTQTFTGMLQGGASASCQRQAFTPTASHP